MLATDDLEFTHLWFEPLLEVFEKLPEVQVVATWDGLFDRGKSSYVMRRSYIESQGTIDEPGKLFHEGYKHCYPDTEFLATAIHRGVFKFVKSSLVKHCHYNSPFAKFPKDKTSEHLEQLASQSDDKARYLKRASMFRGADRLDVPFE